LKRVVLLSLALTFCLAAPASAATFTVNTTADTEVVDGCGINPQCSLRDAITAASAADGNVVAIPAGTFELNIPDVLGDLDIGADMTITGAGARQTVVDANELSRVFAITSAGDTVSISGLTVTGGLSSTTANPGNGDSFNGDGGGIFTEGALTLTDVAVTDNEASLGGGGTFLTMTPLRP
jgi:CSLREA domain-containing protein